MKIQTWVRTRRGTRVGSVIALLVAALIVVLSTTGPLHAEEPDVGGLYRGQQSGQSFDLTLRQSGMLLQGTIRFANTAETTMIGGIHDRTVILVRQSDPVEVWLGRAEDDRLEGRWFSASAAGEWFAERVDGNLAVEKTVEPSVIASGVTTDPLTYTIRIGNRSDAPALNVQVKDTELPEFFTLTRIEVAVNDTPVTLAANDRISDADGLAIGTIPAGGNAVVRLAGSASPQRAGTFVNRATAAGSNTERASARAALTVAGPRAVQAQVANRFRPETVESGAADRVRYTITLTQLGGHDASEVVVTDRTILTLLRDATVAVRGADAEGALDTGLTIGPTTNASGRVRIIVTGSAEQLEPGTYTSTVSMTGAGSTTIASATASLIVEERPLCEDEDQGERDRERGQTLDRSRPADARCDDGAERGRPARSR